LPSSRPLLLLVALASATGPTNVKISIFGPMCVAPNDLACGYPIWSSVGHAANIVLEKINENNWIPGVQLVTDFYDTACSGGLGATTSTEVILQDSPDWPFGVVGCACSGCTMGAAKTLNVARVPQISYTATNADLSNRAVYPSIYRILPPDAPAIAAWFEIFAAFGWYHFAHYYDNEFGFGMISVVDQLLEDSNGTMVDVLQGTPFRLMKDKTVPLASNLVDEIISTRVRGIMCNAYDTYTRHVLCQMEKKGVVGMLGINYGWLDAAWATAVLDTPCTPDEMKAQEEHWLVTRAPAWGLLTEQTPFDPSMTIGDFKAEFYARGNAGPVTGGYPELANSSLLVGSVVADAVFMMALTLKTMLAEGHSISDLIRANATTWTREKEVMQATNFYGLSGPVYFPADQFAHGAGDRIGTFDVIQIAGGSEDIVAATSSTGVVMVPGKEFLFEENYNWTHKPPMLFQECEDGLVYDFATASCLGCSTNMQYIQSEKKCLCVPGFYSDAGTCHQCALGKYSATPGTQSCANCEAGKFSLEAASSCSTCPVGRYAPGLNNSECLICGEGHSNPEAWTTTALVQDAAGNNLYSPVQGATSSDACYCDEGYRLGGGECVACTEGQVCEGMGIATVAEQYMADGGDIARIYRCFGAGHRCVGGPPGQECAAGREGIQCAMCEPGMTPRDDGTCGPCDGPDSAVFGIAIVVVVICLVGVYFVLDREQKAGSTAHSLLLVAISGSQVVAAIQVLGVISNMTIDWDEPFLTLLDIAKLVTFNIDILRPGCIATFTPTSKYVGSMAIVFIGLAAMLLLFVVSVVIIHKGRFRERLPILINSLGTIAMTFFISIVSTSMNPLQCAEHPDDKWTLRAYPTVKCWEGGEHGGMVGLGILFTLAPLGFLAMVARAVWLLPKRMRSMDASFLQCYRFLFFRFKIESYWYVLFFLVKNMLIALVPVFPNVVVQVLLLNLVLITAFGLVSHIMPWRVRVANFLDIVASVGVCLIVSLMSIYVTADTSAVSTLFCILMIASLCMMVAGMAYGIVKVLMPKQKQFHFFICHHKAGCGAFARLLKFVLCEVKPSANVFIDSDNLSNLDKLFDTVAQDVQQLVVLCSAEILRRPWCVGEITVAMSQQVSTLPCICADFTQPDDDFIKTFADHVDMQCLTENAIELQDVEAALAWLKQLPSKNVAPKLLLNSTKSLAAEICGVSMASVPKAGTQKDAEVLIAVDEENSEAIATARIMCTLLLQHAKDLVLGNATKAPKLVLDLKEDETSSSSLKVTLPTSAKTVAFILTGDCLRTKAVMMILREAVSKECALIPIVGDERFRFPTPEFYTALSTLYRSVLGVEQDALVGAVEGMFKNIAVLFQPMASLSVLNTQSHAAYIKIYCTVQPSSSKSTATRSLSDRAVKSLQEPAGDDAETLGI
jgi:hypothetical protein